MPDLKITELTALASANLAATDPIAVVSLAGSDTKKITAKDFVQKAVTLIDDASIPNAKVSLSGISGTNLSAGTVAVSKLDTSTIPATGGVTVSSSNLQLVAPTTPIVRNAGTGSLEHANSGVTAGTYTKVTVDVRGHVTVGAAVAAADLPIAISGTVGVMSPGTGLAVTGGGVLNHSSSVTAGTTSGFTYNAQGHITGAVALAGADLPISTSSVIGAVRPGTGLSVDGNGILAVTAATNAALGGVIAGSDFSVTTGTISLAAQAGIAAGQYTKVTINSKGVTTAGTVLSAGDIPNLAASQITSGTLAIDRYGANTITGAKLANYATGKISEAFPTADYISQLYFNPLDRTLYMWDGNVFQPIGVSYGQVVFSGTYDAGTNLITSVTTEGAAIGLTVGGALTAPVTANKSHYVVVDQPGTGTAPAPTISLSPPDMLLSNGTTWILLDVSDTVTAQLASNIQVSPAGNIASTNVQSALQELDDEKLAKAGGTLTGNLALNTGIAIVYEGATTNDFETTLYVVDPTADRTILLPNVSGTVVTTGDTGTVTSTMLLDGTILNEDINASAAIVDTKLATIATALKVSNSATTAASANTASAIVARDASGNFTAGTITAALTGAASSNVLKAGDTMTGALVVPLASAPTPSLTFTGDLNTGIYSPGADQVAVATNGTGRLFVDASGRVIVGAATAAIGTSFEIVGNASGQAIGVRGRSSDNIGIISFHPNASATEYARIQSNGDSSLAFGTGSSGSERLRITSAGLVGIGTSGPSFLVDCIASSLPTLRIYDNLGSGTRVSGRLLLGASTTRGVSIANSTDTYDDINAMVFSTTESTGVLTERVRISPEGRLGIGTTSPGSPLTIESSAGNQVKITYPSIASYFLNATSGGDLAINKDGSEKARIDSSGRLLIGTITQVGNVNGGILQLGSGITFPATPVATTDVNTLDDYEEGTFTPTAGAGITINSGTPAYSGFYTKIGRTVHVSITQTAGNITTTVGAGAVFTGLPFTPGTALQACSVTNGSPDISGTALIYNSPGTGAIYIGFTAVSQTNLTFTGTYFT